MMKRATSQPDFSHTIPDDQHRDFLSNIDSDSYCARSKNTSVLRDCLIPQFHPSFVDSPHRSNADLPPQSLMQSQNRGQQSASMYLHVGSNSNKLSIPATIQNSSSAPDLLALRFQDSLQLSNSPSLGSPSPVIFNNFVQQMPQPAQSGFSTQVLVPDSLIGAIVGRGGKTLNELQQQSNTRIRISQRGEYVPGTRNRIVTIRGQMAQNVYLAQDLINQRTVPSYIQSSSQQQHCVFLNSSSAPAPIPQPKHENHVINDAFSPSDTHGSLHFITDNSRL